MNAQTRVYAERGASQCSIGGCTAPYYGSSFCKKHHQWHWKRGLLPRPKTITIAEKLLAYSVRDESTGCRIWQKALDDHGYGLIARPGGINDRAHRVSFETFVGPIPDGFEICHKCDNPPCMEPTHLFAGTHAANMEDSRRKGRAKNIPIFKGFNHHRAILTPEHVEYIRASKETGKSIAARLGVNPLTIYRCRNGETYRDSLLAQVNRMIGEP